MHRLLPSTTTTLRAHTRSLDILAPAKVNFYLRVVGRRPDGYHLLESVVAPLSIYDRIALHELRSGEIRVRSNDPNLPGGPDNLAWRAAALLRQYARTSAGVEIRLRKRIPAGAGLGGGSSDAAAVLLGLNQLWRLRLSTAKLAKLGSRLGADVPFFVHGRPAVLRGVGERVRPCKAFPETHIALVWPGFAIATPWVYQNLNFSLSRVRSPSPLAAFLRGRRDLVSILENDLEAVAVLTHSRILTLERSLARLGAVGARMTGSGSAVFGIFATPTAARRAAAAFRCRGVWSVAVHTLARAPAPKWRTPRRAGRIR